VGRKEPASLTCQLAEFQAEELLEGPYKYFQENRRDAEITEGRGVTEENPLLAEPAFRLRHQPHRLPRRVHRQRPPPDKGEDHRSQHRRLPQRVMQERPRHPPLLRPQTRQPLLTPAHKHRRRLHQERQDQRRGQPLTGIRRLLIQVNHHQETRLATGHLGS